MEDSAERDPTDSSDMLEELSREECLRLLGSVSIGRIAVMADSESPLVVPVNYVVDGEAVVFRTDPGTKLTALRERPVSFQVDSIDPFHRTGWSVLLQGRAHEIPTEQAPDTGAEPWVGAKKHTVRLAPDTISGRRIRLPEITPDPRGYL